MMRRACELSKAGWWLIGTTISGGCMFTPSFSQTHVSVSVFNHAIALPGSVLVSPFHPGADVGLTFIYKEHPRHERFVHAQLGMYNQRLIHTGVQLYGEYHYRYQLAPQLGLDASAGLGGILTVLGTEHFRLKESGEYEPANKARLHAQASAAVGLTYGQRHRRLQPFVQYRFRVFTPFAKAYVPFVPCTSLHIGAFYRLIP